MRSLYQITKTNNAGYALALNQIKARLDSSPHFLNSPFYGQWQEVAGNKVLYFTIFKRNECVGCGLAVRFRLPNGYGFYYCPYGPLVVKWSDELKPGLIQFFKQNLDEKNLFLRIDADNLPPRLFRTASASAAATSALQPRNEWLLNIALSDEEILAGMKQKCRYQIRMSEKAGAIFSAKKSSARELDAFYEPMLKTASRDHFGLLPKANYKAAFDAAIKFAFIGEARIAGNTAASAFCVIYEGVCHYVYGASDPRFLKAGPGYFLQWQCIKEAKKRGARVYNFGGISGGVKGDKLAGVTQFKQRFGGYGVAHELPSDIVLNPLGYRLFSAYKKIRLKK